MSESISRYKILEILGRGAMGVVYRCRDESLHRDVAIKVISEESSRDPSYRQRFLTEARSASALNHPNVITIHEIGTDRGRDFIAMEYVQGQSLQSLLAERGALTPDEILGIGLQLAKGLAAAHRAGIVHRDLKPGNVILTPEGLVKILDFGLARQRESLAEAAGDREQTGDATMAASYTRPGMILGTPGFMSPEQARGDQADHRSDQFSLGCILHAMASGKAPFSGESVVDVLHNVLHRDPEPLDRTPSDLPAGLRDVMRRCLRKKPEERFDDTAELEGSLERIRQAAGASLLPGAAPSVSGRRFPGRLKLGLGLAAVAVIAAAAIFLSNLNSDSARETITVTARDEQGQPIRRELPAAESRRRLAIFPFEVAAPDSARPWLAFAVSELLVWDLLQDYRLLVDELRDLMGNSTFAEAAKKAGYPEVVGAPLHLKREVAQDSNCTHMVTGSIALEEGRHELQVEIRDADSGRMTGSFRLDAPDLLPLIDDASLRIRRELGVPEEHLRECPDLPIADIATRSMPAIELAARAAVARDLDNDLQEARRLLEQAVAEDPAFAVGLWTLYALYPYLERPDAARQTEILNSLMTHLTRLPERMQFAIKASYFQSRGENDKMLAVLKLWRDLYPHDIMPHHTLLLVYRTRNETENLLATLQRLLELDPDNPEYLLLAGETCQRAGDFEAARGHFESYIERRPEDPKALSALGQLSQTLGDHAEAKRYLERALLLSPKDLETRIDLAKCEFHLGNAAVWPEMMRSLLAEPLSPDERLQVKLELAEYYDLTGRLQRAHEVCKDALEEAEGRASTLWILLTKNELARQLARAGRVEDALAMVAELRSSYSLAFKPLVVLAPVEVHLELEDSEAAEKAAGELASTIESMGLELLRFKWLEAMGRIREQQGRFEEAEDFYRRRIDLRPDGVRIYHYLGRCLHKMGRLEEAREALSAALTRSPHQPRVLLEMALVEHESGRTARALEHLRTALDVWSKADSTFAPARQAREKLEDWSRAS
ncbi:MAG: tetratricopeptide repeat protein [Candidatus Eisenbacteria bacterium]|nr:tetratricopeptide repeat protein [Candidatus Eisenbacteria bacterium]